MTSIYTPLYTLLDDSSSIIRRKIKNTPRNIMFNPEIMRRRAKDNGIQDTRHLIKIREGYESNNPFLCRILYNHPTLSIRNLPFYRVLFNLSTIWRVFFSRLSTKIGKNDEIGKFRYTSENRLFDKIMVGFSSKTVLSSFFSLCREVKNNE